MNLTMGLLKRMSSPSMEILSNQPFTHLKIHGCWSYTHHGVITVKSWDLSGLSWQLNSKELLRLPKLKLIDLGNLIKFMISKATPGSSWFQQVSLLFILGAKDKKVYYVFDGARTADAMAEWTHEKIRTNKGFLVERLVSEQRWKDNCIDL